MTRGNGGRVGRALRWAGFAVLAGATASGLVWLWVHAPDFYEPGEDGRLQAIALTRTGVLTAAAGLLVLANLLESRRATNLTHTRELAEQAETHRANDLTHTRELYARAVDQLGSATLDVRLGGIYALERLARDSPPDQRTAVEVLSAFVREHTTPGRAGTARRGRRAALPTPAKRAGGLDTDIQAALTILGRLPTRKDVPRRANLYGAYLPRARLDGNLSGARLSRANLTGADLIGTDLTDAILSETILTSAHLAGANLTGAEKLTQEQLDAALGDGTTVLPEGLARPGHWPEKDPRF